MSDTSRLFVGLTAAAFVLGLLTGMEMEHISLEHQVSMHSNQLCPDKFHATIDGDGIYCTDKPKD